jgi:hypothetical protein
MNIKSVALKSIFIVMVLLSCFISFVFAISLFVFIFNPDDKSFLYMFLGTLLLTALFWASTFYLANLDKNKTKEQKIQELKDLLTKMPLILASSVITSFYVLIYFFFFGFLTVSKYGKGGWGGDAGQALIWVFLLIAMGIFGTVMYRVFKTEKQDITLTLYNQFTVLKWSSLIALIFGIWSTYYFYHNEGVGGWAAMFVWDFILYVVYKFFDRLSNKAQDSITDSNLNRIIHEKKKNMLNKETNTKPENIGNSSIADELKKIKELLDQGAITQEEFDNQKRKLI